MPTRPQLNQMDRDGIVDDWQRWNVDRHGKRIRDVELAAVNDAPGLSLAGGAKSPCWFGGEEIRLIAVKRFTDIKVILKLVAAR